MKDTEIALCADAISFRQLRMFESVGRLSSVRRGSDECNLSQPAVTQAIRKLEQQIDQVLFERRASGSYLTAEGAILQRRVQSFLGLLERGIGSIGIVSPTEAKAAANRLTRSQVRSLLGVIEHGGFDAAAEHSGLSVASLHRAARDLDSNLGGTVFYRTASGLMVTREGLELGRVLKLATLEIEWALREIDLASGQSKAKLTIGALPFGGSLMLAEMLDAFLAEHPNADVRIITEGAAEMIAKLRAGEVDIVVGLAQEIEGDDLRHEILAETPYEIVCRAGHPLAGKRATREELLMYDWIVGTDGSSRRQCFDRLFEGHPLPTTSIAISSLPIIRHLIKSSDRLTIITNYERIYEGVTVAAVDFPDLDTAPSIGVTLRNDWVPTRIHQDFLAQLKQQVTVPVERAAPGIGRK